ncbi:MAG: UDP-N-acetylmuramoyl-L-alanine--D-glutamate ligase [Planctomycetes bacterium]|nr:UDP-N-acetylmuramoyl-L-alanine--D-glutamate ligase [Planctomycetota bacterium]
MSEFEGKRATVWGLGVFGGGAGVARYLVEAGAQVTVIDQKPRERLERSVASLDDLEICFHLGEAHRPADLLEADLVVKSPAIPPRNEWLPRLKEAGVLVRSEIGLALSRVRVPWVAVSGSKGKTTTASLAGALAGGPDRGVLVAGNNERPLTDALRAAPQALVVEISSFMADALARERAAGIAFPAPAALVLTQLCPEHLNWHEGVEDYYGAKLSLLELGPQEVVIPRGETELEARLGEDPRLVRVGGAPTGPRDLHWSEGWATREGARLFAAKDLSLLGAHNRTNALLAASAAMALGARPTDLAAGARGFEPLEHRLEPVARRGALTFVNDSTATTPEASIAALEAAPKPVVLLAGGSDKGADYAALGAAAAREAQAVICLGAVGERIALAIEASAGPAKVIRCKGSFEEAFALGLSECDATGSLLMSPAAASYDMFANFKARGERFRELSQAAAKT